MTVTFKRNLGRVLWVGDSITLGSTALTGGWRKKLQELLEAAGVYYVAVGGLTTNSSGMTQPNHQGVSGDSVQATGASLGGYGTTYTPHLVLVGWGMNDLGIGRTPTQYLDGMDSAIDALQTSRPNCRICVQQVLSPTAVATSYYANIANYTTAQAQLITRMATQGVTVVDTGSPVRSDGVHPVDGATGYDVMATNIYNSLMALIA